LSEDALGKSAHALNPIRTHEPTVDMRGVEVCDSDQNSCLIHRAPIRHKKRQSSKFQGSIQMPCFVTL
jgi:hypothetical protein